MSFSRECVRWESFSHNSLSDFHLQISVPACEEEFFPFTAYSGIVGAFILAGPEFLFSKINDLSVSLFLKRHFLTLN